MDEGGDEHAKNLLLLKGNSPEESVWTIAEMNMPKNYFIKGTLAWEECVDDGRDEHAKNLLY